MEIDKIISDIDTTILLRFQQWFDNWSTTNSFSNCHAVTSEEDATKAKVLCEICGISFSVTRIKNSYNVGNFKRHRLIDCLGQNSLQSSSQIFAEVCISPA